MLTVLGDKIIFVADDGIRGAELWITDGEPGHARLLKDIWPGADGSNPEKLYAFGKLVLFTALTPADPAGINSLGSELWVTDGTAENTILVKDIYDGPTGTQLEWMTQWKGIAYFDASDATHGRELWRTDGTAAGTSLVKDLNPGSIGAEPSRSSVALLPDGKFVFASLWSGEVRMWISDGTDSGTKILMPASLDSHFEISLNGKALFTSASTANGSELWIASEKNDSPELLKDIVPGPEGSAPGRCHRLGDNVLFKAWDAIHGEELWRTDGTGDGTVLLKDLNPGLSDSSPYYFTAAGPYLYFVAVAPRMGREIWRTDGTADGTILLKDIYPGPSESVPYALCAVGDKLLFTALENEHGEELWCSDGTPDGTRMVKDINPKIVGGVPESGFPDKTVEFHGKAYFRATTEKAGCELWCSDGTEDGTILLDDIWNANSFNPSSFPHELTPVNGSLFFVATDFEHGNELYCIRPGAPGATLVRDIFPGVASSDPHDLTAVGGLLYFGADDGTNGDELWRSDGTLEGTALVEDYALGLPSSHPHHLVTFAGTIFFVSWRPEDGNELRALKGTSIRRIRDIAPKEGSSNPKELVAIGGQLYFCADDGVHGEELWVTDGEDKSTYMVYDLLPQLDTSALPRYLTQVDQMLYFAANDGVRGTELWSLKSRVDDLRCAADIAGPLAAFQLGSVSKNYSGKKE